MTIFTVLELRLWDSIGPKRLTQGCGHVYCFHKPISSVSDSRKVVNFRGLADTSCTSR